MKSTGIVRKIDELGRYVVPAELRRNLGIKNQMPGKNRRTRLEISLDVDKIIMDIANKSTIGVTREVDNLGRIVIPKELRKALDIGERDSLETYIDGEQIILKKYEPACIFCHEAKEVIDFKGKNVCKKCIKELKK